MVTLRQLGGPARIPSSNPRRAGFMVSRAISHDAPRMSTPTVLEGIMIARIAMRIRSDRGATAVEYGLMVALIAVIIIGAVGALGTAVLGTFNTAAGAI
jgi:pilus assembly protein Flp/PilA